VIVTISLIELARLILPACTEIAVVLEVVVVEWLRCGVGENPRLAPRVLYPGAGGWCYENEDLVF